MNLNTLSDQIEKNIVDNPDGWGQDITFTYLSTGQVENTRAMVQELTIDKDTEKGVVKKNEQVTVFLSVFLPLKPNRGDYITHNGEKHYVDSMTNITPYDITCISNSKHITSRSKRVLR